MITDFFVASPEEIRHLDWTRSIGDIFQCAQFESVDTVKLGHLEYLLVGTESYEATRQMDGSEIKAEKEGPWIYTLNDRLVRAMSALTPESALDPVRKWIETEEWQADRATPESVDGFVEMLIDLGKLASRALASGKNMYLYMSL
ncbi:MAG TPA: hypothetical protein VF950_11810 [Planctomycetota bacterium]